MHDDTLTMHLTVNIMESDPLKIYRGSALVMQYLQLSF